MSVGGSSIWTGLVGRLPGWFFFRFVLGCRHSRKFRVNKQQSSPELSPDCSEEAKCQLQFKNELGKNNQVTPSSHQGGS